MLAPVSLYNKHFLQQKYSYLNTGIRQNLREHDRGEWLQTMHLADQ